VYLYNFKFGEYFRDYSDLMFQSIWSLIDQNKVQANKSCEKLVRVIVRYMGEITQLASKQDFIKMNLMKIFDILILPNISITADDKDEFEDDPDAYIRNDLEESDIETRRRHCMKFVQQLSSKFPAEVSQLIGSYINNLLAEYNQNREQNWPKKVTLLNLLITASIQHYNFKNGATDILIDEQTLF
jgi:exportin-2 (importin alpha re-exporter)